jgi:hypothetical protein
LPQCERTLAARQKAARVNETEENDLLDHPDQTAERPQAAFLLVATNGL